MDDKIDLTSGRHLPKGTKYNARIKADEGYAPGRLNIESGVLDKNTTIKATMATKNRAALLLKQFDHQYIKITTYSSLGKINKIYDTPNYYLYFKIGTIYSAEMVPRYGYELVNNVKNVHPNVKYKLYTNKYIYAYSDARPKPVDVSIKRNKHSSIIIHSKRGIITVDHETPNDTKLEIPNLLRYDDHYYITTIPDYGYILKNPIKDKRYELNKHNKSFKSENGKFSLNIEVPVEEIKIKYNIESICSDWSHQHIELVNKTTNSTINLSQSNHDTLVYDYLDDISIKVVPDKGYVPGKLEVVMNNEDGKPIHYDHILSSEFKVIGNAKIFLSTATKIDSGILTINYLDKDREKEWLGQWDTHYCEFDPKNPQVNHYLDNNHQDEPIYGQLSLEPNEAYTNYIHNDFKKDTPDRKWFYMNHLEKDNKIKYVMVYIKQTPNQVITVTNVTTNKKYTKSFKADLNDVIRAELAVNDPNVYLKGKLNATENEDIELHGGVLITASPAVKYRFKVFISKYINQRIVVECNGVKHIEDFDARTGDKIHAYVESTNINYDPGKIINKADVIVADHDLKFSATDATPKVYPLHIVLKPYQTLRYFISKNIYGNDDDVSEVVIDGGENGLTKDIDIFYGQLISKPRITISDKYKYKYKFDTTDTVTTPGYIANNVELVDATDLHSSMKGFYVRKPDGVIESKYDSILIHYKVSIVSSDYIHQSVELSYNGKTDSNSMIVEYDGELTVTHTIHEGYMSYTLAYLKSTEDRPPKIISDSTIGKVRTIKYKVYSDCILYLPKLEEIYVYLTMVSSQYASSAIIGVKDNNGKEVDKIPFRDGNYRVKYGYTIIPQILYEGYTLPNRTEPPFNFNLSGKYTFLNDGSDSFNIYGNTTINLLSPPELTIKTYTVTITSSKYQTITIKNVSDNIIEEKVCGEKSTIKITAKYGDIIELTLKSVDDQLYDSGDLVVKGRFKDKSQGATITTNPPKRIKILGDVSVTTTEAKLKAVLVKVIYPKDNPTDSELKISITNMSSLIHKTHECYKKDIQFLAKLNSRLKIRIEETNVFKYTVDDTSSALVLYGDSKTSTNNGNVLSTIPISYKFKIENDRVVSSYFETTFVLTPTTEYKGKPYFICIPSVRKNKIQIHTHYTLPEKFTKGLPVSYNPIFGINVSSLNHNIPGFTLNNNGILGNNTDLNHYRDLIREKKFIDARKLLQSSSYMITSDFGIQDQTIPIEANEVVTYGSITHKGYNNYDIAELKMINPKLPDNISDKLSDYYTKNNMYNSRIIETNDSNISKEIYDSEEYSKYRLDLYNYENLLEIIAVTIPEMIDGSILDFNYVVDRYQLDNTNKNTKDYMNNTLSLSEYNKKYGYNYIQNHSDVVPLYIKNEFNDLQGARLYIFTYDHIYKNAKSEDEALLMIQYIADYNKTLANGFDVYRKYGNYDAMRRYSIFNITDKEFKVFVPIDSFVYIEVDNLDKITDGKLHSKQKIKIIDGGIKDPKNIRYMVGNNMENDKTTYEGNNVYHIQDRNVLIELAKPELSEVEVRIMQNANTIMRVYEKDHPDKLLFNGAEIANVIQVDNNEPIKDTLNTEKSIFVKPNTKLIVETYAFHEDATNAKGKDLYNDMDKVLSKLPSYSYRVFELEYDSNSKFSSHTVGDSIPNEIPSDISEYEKNHIVQYTITKSCTIKSNNVNEKVFIFTNGYTIDDIDEKYAKYIKNDINKAPQWALDYKKNKTDNTPKLSIKANSGNDTDNIYILNKNYSMILNIVHDVKYELIVKTQNVFKYTDNLKCTENINKDNSANSTIDILSVNPELGNCAYLITTLKESLVDLSYYSSKHMTFDEVFEPVIPKDHLDYLCNFNKPALKVGKMYHMFGGSMSIPLPPNLLYPNKFDAAKAKQFCIDFIHDHPDTQMNEKSYYALNVLPKMNIDTSNVSGMGNVFKDCYGLTSIDITNWDVKNVTYMRGMFYGCSSLTNLDISNFDTKNVTHMRYMFFGCSSLTNLDVSKWNTKNVTDMYGMFLKCSKLTLLDISNFDTNNVTSMGHMFEDCASLTSLDVSKWNTKNVTDMHGMFYSCSKLTSLDVSNFNTKNVTDMSEMFRECSSLTSLDVSKWDTKNVGYIGFIFYKCSKLTSLDVSKFDTKNTARMQYMFSYCSSLTSLDLSKWNTKNVSDMSGMFDSCYKLTNLDVSKWNTKNVKNMSDMFYNCSLKYIILEDTSDNNKKLLDKIVELHNKYKKVKVLTTKENYDKYKDKYKFLDDMGNYDIHRHDGMVDVKPHIKIIDIDLHEYAKRNINDYTNITKINDNKLWNTDSNIRYRALPNASSAFNGMKNLKELKINVDMSNVTNMKTMFSSCSSLTSLDLSKFDTKNVTGMDYMFSSCSSLTSIDVSKFDTKNVTGMENMFEKCSSLTSLDVSKWNTNNVTSMGHMFEDCASLASLDVSKWNTDNVTNMEWMFNGCSSLTNLDVSKFDTKNVINMSNMFYNCSKLTSLDVSKWNTKNVTDMWDMFDNCSSLTNLNVSKWNTENVNNMGFIFNGCTSLTSLDLYKWNTKNVTNMHGMFSYCSSLANLDISNFNTKNASDMSGIFYDCSSLRYIILEDVSDNNKNLLDKIVELHSKYNKVKVLTTKENYEKYKDKYTFLDDMNNYNISRHDGEVEVKIPIKTIDIDLHEFYKKIDNYKNITELPKNIKDKLYNTDPNVIYRALPNAGGAFGDFDSSNSMENLKELKINVDMSNVTSMGFMFFKCSSLTSLDISKWDTKNVTNMHGMFFSCSSLTSLDVSNFDTKNVTEMTDMFYNCSKLTSLDVSNFDTKNVSDMSDMFQDCSKLTSLDISKWNTKNVSDMFGMFYRCFSLTNLDISNFNTKTVNNMSDMFKDCSSLTNLDISNFNTKNVTSTTDMFKDCSSLKYIILEDIGNNKPLLEAISQLADKYSKVKVLTTKENYDRYKSTYSFLDDMNNYNIDRHNGQVDITHK